MSEHAKNRCQDRRRHETCDGATSPARKVFYHTRLDKQGYIDPKMGFGAIRKDFRTLTAMLCWMQTEFGDWSDGWAIDCVGKTEPHALMLKHDLERLIGVARPDVYMRMNRNCPDYERCRVYCFFVSENEGEPPDGFSFTEQEEEKFVQGVDTDKVDFAEVVSDVLRGFCALEIDDPIHKAFEFMVDLYGDWKNMPNRIGNMRSSDNLTVADLIALADECNCGCDEQLAAVLYVLAYNAGKAQGAVLCGEALAKLAELYYESDWPRSGGRECDYMNIVKLLTVAHSFGHVKEALRIMNDVRSEFTEDIGENEVDEEDIGYMLRNYQPDAVCFIAFCLGAGIGWKQDRKLAHQLFTAAAENGYLRAQKYVLELEEKECVF